MISTRVVLHGIATLLGLACSSSRGAIGNAAVMSSLQADTARNPFTESLAKLLTIVPRRGATICVDVRDMSASRAKSDPAPSVLHALGTSRDVVRGSDCPMTIPNDTSRTRAPERLAEQRTPAYINPYRVTMYADEPDSLAIGLVRMELWQGVTGMRYRCLRRDKGWRCLNDIPLVRPPLN